ncbi:MAG: hypothetical protein CMH56_09615 [Myxococcales bacterium]|nr:hypothetical protein [Myxococcales bacterium]
MRFFSKLEHWFKSQKQSESETFQQRELFSEAFALGNIVQERLPNASAKAHVDLINQAVREARAGEPAKLWQLDNCLFLLAVSNPNDEAQDEQLLSSQIDAALSPLRHNQDQLFSLTWTAIRQSRPPFDESYEAWAEDPQAFEGELGLVFFVDLEALALSVSNLAHQTGLNTKRDPEDLTLRVSDGQYVAEVNINALLVEALWTGRGLLSVAKSRANQLPAELRSFKSLLFGLRRRFPFLNFEVGPDAISMETTQGVFWLDYRHIMAAIKKSNCGQEHWLQRIHWQDLIHLDQQPTVLVRSLEYLSAWPEALHSARENHALVAMYEEGGRLRPVLGTGEDAPNRFEHYFDEAMRQLGFHHFKAHAFLDEEETQGYGLAFVGDHIATATLDPRLISGLLEGFGPYPEIVSVEVLSEDVMVVCSTDYPASRREVILNQAQTLSKELTGYGADPLVMRKMFKLDKQCLGQADLVLISQSFFFLLDKATNKDLAMLPGRSDFFMGVAKEMIGQQDDAILAFQKAVSLDRKNGDFNFALGRILSRHLRHAEAVDYLQLAHGAYPQRAEVANTYGLALEKTGDTPKALEVFRHAANVTPDDADILTNLGRTLVQMSLFEEANNVLARALALDHDNTGAHTAMADLCLKTGDRKAALMHLREALTEDPKNEQARKMFEALWHGSLGDSALLEEDKD